jgi:hypothetical protein
MQCRTNFTKAGTLLIITKLQVICYLPAPVTVYQSVLNDAPGSKGIRFVKREFRDLGKLLAQIKKNKSTVIWLSHTKQKKKSYQH